MVRRTGRQANGDGGIDGLLDLPIIPVSEPQRGLIPTSIPGIYATPDDPTSPFDCDRWSSSPFCGGIPFSWEIFDPGISLVLEPGCVIGIESSPTFGFVNFPSFQIAYVRPECRIDEPPPEPVPGERIVEGLDLPINDETVVYVFYSEKFSWHQQHVNSESCGSTANNVYQTVNEGGTRTFTHKCPGRVITYNGIPETAKLECNFAGSSKDESYGYVRTFFGDLCYFGEKQVRASETPTSSWLWTSRTTTYTYRFDDERFVRDYTISPGRNSTPRYIPVNLAKEAKHELTAVTVANASECLHGKWKAVKIWLGTFTGEVPSDVIYTVVLEKIFNAECAEIPIRKKKRPPPPPPPPPPRCCMSCCPPQSDEELKRMIRLLMQRVGVQDYPIPVPTSITQKNPGTKQIQSLTEFTHWFFHRFDEIVGEWEIVTQIKDSDPTKAGDQTEDIRLPNLAEAVAEMFGLLSQASINSEIIVNMCTRLMIEAGSDKQQNYKSYKLLTALFDYLGVETKEKIFKVPMVFKPGAEKIEDLLKEVEVDVTAEEYVEKATLKDNLHDLLHAAAVIRAVHWRQLDPKGDIKAELIKLIKNQSATADKINEDSDDFDEFCRDVEVGFTNQAGISDSLNPYGKPYANRPNIRILGNTSDDGGTAQ